MFARLITSELIICLQSQLGDISFRLGNYNQIHSIAIVADLQRGELVEPWHFRPHGGDRDLDFAVVGSDLLSFGGKAMQPLAIRLGHADKQRDAHNTEHKSDVA